MMSRFLLTVSFGSLLPAIGADTIDYNRDIRPIVAEYCYHCHGPDPGTRKEDLRFDREEGFFGQRDGLGPTVVKGNAEASEFFKRIISKDPDEVMPPPKEKKVMKPQEIALIKKWIEQGAPWQAHWAFIKPKRPEVPKVDAAKLPVGAGDWTRNPIDAFVLKKLEAAKLSPAPQAAPNTLARRLSLDIIGLPPKPEEVDAFVKASAQDAQAAVLQYVDKLLASPHYGEHRGRYWLDAARYGDTHGLHFDNYREMWAYRDWVIGAFNRNLPFDQFTVEQLAGDLLPNATRDQLIATGFQRCNITTNEGGTIDEENAANYARDRAETTSWVWLGLTANCAACHDHKFDPITAKDFYAMTAFFRNTTQGPKDGNVHNTAPVLVMPQGADAARYEALPGEIAKANQAMEAKRKELRGAYEKWATEAQFPQILEQTEKQLALHVPLTEGQGQQVAYKLAGATRNATAAAPLQWRPDGKLGSAPRLSKESTLNLGPIADIERDKPFTLSVWARPSSDGKSGGAVVAKMEKGEAGFRGWDLHLIGQDFAMHLIHKWQENAIKVRTTSKPAKPGEWRHVVVTYDGSSKAAGVAIYIDGNPAKVKVDADALKDTIRSTAPFRIGQRDGSDFFAGSVQDVRLYERVVDPAEVRLLANLAEARTILTKAVKDRTPQEKDRLFDVYVAGDEALIAAAAKVAALQDEKKSIEQRSPVTHIQQERMDRQPMARVLFRGAYDQPREEVKPAGIAALHPMPPGAPANRLGLAQWITAPENPLTARVMVNRFWQELFGTGIVRTAEDLGLMSEPPSHPELIDWLAVEFRESGWDVKKLIRLMATSATYQQASITTPEKIERDPANRLLSRGPRFRMDAEMIRDYALTVSGLLNPHIGGPSVKPYQPDGVWEAVAMPESNTRKYQRDTGDKLYRRSLYTFWKRAAPPASLEVFNAPSREVSCVRRERTNTPLQALVTLNDPQFVEAARTLAQTALQQAKGDDQAALDHIARRVLNRPLRPEENKVILDGHKGLLTHYEQKPDDAKALLAVGESKTDDALPPARLAAWTMTCNTLMNLDEVLNK